MRVPYAAVTLTLVAVAISTLLEASPGIRPPRTNSVRRTEYVASLSGREGRKVSGSATARPSADGKATDVTVTLEGDTPGATRPWHIHSGSCKQSGGVVGGGRAYTPIAIDLKGQGKATATVPALLADSATYYVNIHDAATAMGTIVACGDLARK
jgi:hypothetical protein